MIAIDISSYQGRPDFAQVKAAGVQLVIMREGGADGGLYLDKVYLANRADARAQGLLIGSYFFNGPAIAPSACADWMLTNGDYRPGDLMVIDVEGSGLAWSPVEVLVWVQEMRARGVRIADIGVYMSASLERAQDWSAVAATGAFLWVASYGSNNGSPGAPPKPTHWAAWSLWQYTSTATCPGVAGRADTSMIAPGFPAGVSTKQEDEYMTDMIYYADTAAGPASKPIASGPNQGLVVAQESMWYAECPGAPLFPLSGNFNYAKGSAATEYSAFAAGKADVSAKRLAVSAQAIADLIASRGTTTKPTGNFDASASSAAALPDPAAWGKAAGDAAATEITAALKALAITAK